VLADPSIYSSLIDPDISTALSAQTLANHELSVGSLARLRAARAATPVPPVSDAVARSDHPVPGRPAASVRVHRSAAGVTRCACSAIP
jgi:hypothetical protein